MIEYSLSIIKPDAVKRNIIGKILSEIEESGLKIVGQKMIKISEELAQEFYIEHANRIFFEDLIKFITSTEVIVQVLKGEEAISNYRKLIGNTNPHKAEVGTIRNKFGLDVQANSVHGSENVLSAKREIDLFFSLEEIFI